MLVSDYQRLIQLLGAGLARGAHQFVLLLKGYSVVFNPGLA